MSDENDALRLLREPPAGIESEIYEGKVAIQLEIGGAMSVFVGMDFTRDYPRSIFHGETTESRI